MYPDNDTMTVLRTLVQMHADLAPVVRTAKAILYDMEAEVEALNRWADEQAALDEELRASIPVAPYIDPPF